MDNIEKWLFDTLVKAKAKPNKKSGEGSRGGNVVGHTASGRPIYDKARHTSHASYSKRDHLDAANHNLATAESYSKKLQDKLKTEPGFEGEKANKVRDFIKDAHKRGIEHQGIANTRTNTSEGRATSTHKPSSAVVPIDEKQGKNLPGNPSLSNVPDKQADLEQLKRAKVLIQKLNNEGKKDEAIALHRHFFGKTTDLV